MKKLTLAVILSACFMVTAIAREPIPEDSLPATTLFEKLRKSDLSPVAWLMLVVANKDCELGFSEDDLASVVAGTKEFATRFGPREAIKQLERTGKNWDHEPLVGLALDLNMQNRTWRDQWAAYSEADRKISCTSLIDAAARVRVIE